MPEQAQAQPSQSQRAGIVAAALAALGLLGVGAVTITINGSSEAKAAQTATAGQPAPARPPPASALQAPPMQLPPVELLSRTEGRLMISEAVKAMAAESVAQYAEQRRLDRELLDLRFRELRAELEPVLAIVRARDTGSRSARRGR